jgi:hypothetical protein
MIMKKHRLGPQNDPRSVGLLKIVSCQKIVLIQLEKVGGYQDPPGSKVEKNTLKKTMEAKKGAKNEANHMDLL